MAPAGLATVARSAVVPAMPMMIALRLRIVLEFSLRQSPGRRIRAALDTAKELDARLGQRVLGAHADAAADQRIHPGSLQKAAQSAMAAFSGVHDLRMDNLPILHIVELELLRVAEMLKNFSIFIRYCDFQMYILLICFWLL